MTSNNVKYLVAQLKAEIKDNAKDIKYQAKQGDYEGAAHLASVNGALVYVIQQIHIILQSEKNERV